jgi:hypothetical protein
MNHESPPPKYPRLRKDLLYRLRKKGVQCDTRQRTIYLPYGEDILKHVQVARLRKEFNFTIQFEI